MSRIGVWSARARAARSPASAGDFHNISISICRGFSQYFDIDVALVRVIWLVCAFFGWGLLAYLVAWIAIEEEPLMLTAPEGEMTKAGNS